MTDHIRTSKALLAEIDAALARLAKQRQQLHDEWEAWQSRLNDQLPERIATSARAGGVSYSTIESYVSSIEHSIKRVRDNFGAAKDQLTDTSKELGSMAHCVSALRHKARRREADVL